MANNAKRLEQLLMNGKPAEEVGAYIAMPEEFKDNYLIGCVMRGKKIEDYKFLVVNGEFCGAKAADIINRDANTILLLGYNGNSACLNQILKKYGKDYEFSTHGRVYSTGPVFCYYANLMDEIMSSSYIILTGQSFPRGHVTAKKVLASRKTNLNQVGIAKPKIEFYDFI